MMKWLSIFLFGVFALTARAQVQSGYPDVSLAQKKHLSKGLHFYGGLGLMMGNQQNEEEWISGGGLQFGSRYKWQNGFYGQINVEFAAMTLLDEFSGTLLGFALGKDIKIGDRSFGLQAKIHRGISWQSPEDNRFILQPFTAFKPSVQYYFRAGAHTTQLSLGFFASDFNETLILEEFSRDRSWEITRTTIDWVVFF